MKKKVLLVLLCFILAGAATGAVLYYLNWSKYQALDPGHETEEVEVNFPGPWTVEETPTVVPAEGETEKEAAVDSGNRLHILLLGLDGGERLADVVMVLTIDTDNKTGRVISVPRDTLAYISGGRDGICKITEIYWYGAGREVMLQNVRRLTGISPHFYIEINFNGFENIVNAIGGVTVDGARLDGAAALALVRDRSQGDHSRISNQQRVMAGLLHEIRQVNDLNQAGPLIRSGLANVRTNMDFDQAKSLYQAAGGFDAARASFYTIPTRWEQINGVWYEVPL